MGKRKIRPTAAETSAKKSRHDVTTVKTAWAETDRLNEDGWSQWGPYLAERQWGTVREDESHDGNCWDDFSHDQAVYRSYTSGEDGLFAFCDDTSTLCLGLALWNGRDRMLKERLYGLTQPQGNHAEDVKECYYYFDGTPSHSYMKMLYKYPQKEFPYDQLLQENKSRTRTDSEYELVDTGVFDDDGYWDVVAEYCKNSPQDILCEYTVYCRGNKDAKIWLLPTVWFRNTWAGTSDEKPVIEAMDKSTLLCKHKLLGDYVFEINDPSGESELLFTENETNMRRMSEPEGVLPHDEGYKDAFHNYVISGDKDKSNQVTLRKACTKSAAMFSFTVPGGGYRTIRCRLRKHHPHPETQAFGKNFDDIINLRRQEADQFYDKVIPENLTDEEKNVARQSYAGLCWTKQHFSFDLDKWLKDQPRDINKDWSHMKNHDVISMPDKWEFPWYATWDLAFQMLPFSEIDINFAKRQLELLLSERYMHPNGQLPAYEFNFSDVNPPVHAWACLSVHRRGVDMGKPDFTFLKHCFHTLKHNFTWWMDNVIVTGSHLFGGGFLGMDNISCVERSNPPEGTHVAQVDGTCWVAFFAVCMLQMALELVDNTEYYDDLACEFLNHYCKIVCALMGEDGGDGLWNAADGFFYDQVRTDSNSTPVKVKSLVGLTPLFPATILNSDKLQKTPKLRNRLDQMVTSNRHCFKKDGDYLLSAVDQTIFSTLLGHMLNEDVFLSSHGIRSLAKHEKYSMVINEDQFTVRYCPGESDSEMFGGNSNWRGPVWLCMNTLLIESLETYARFYGEDMRYAFPTGGEEKLSLTAISVTLCERLVSLFLPDDGGDRPCHGNDGRYANDPLWKDLVLFYEYFHGDTGRGCGASHQTGWTSLVTCLLRRISNSRKRKS